MTISTTTRKAGPFTGNGSTTAFPFTFKVFGHSDLAVIQADLLDVETTLVLGSDYSVALNADQDANPGGTVTLSTALTTDYHLVINSNVPDTQETDLTNMGGFYPETVNDALDRLTIQIQQLRAVVNRSITLPVTAEDGDFTLPLPEANQLIAWNGEADGLVNMDPAELVSVVSYGTTVTETYEGDGATVSFTLPSTPGTLGNLRVSIDGVVQVPGADYSWSSGTTLTFSSAPPDGTTIFVQFQEALDELPDTVSPSELLAFSSKLVGPWSGFNGYVIPTGVNLVRTSAYDAVPGQGAARYALSSDQSSPAGPGRKQSANGLYFDLSETTARLEHFGDPSATNTYTSFAELFGWGRKIELPAQTCLVTTTLVLSQSNTWIKGVPGRTVIKSTSLTKVFQLASLASVVIEDVIFESAAVSASEEFFGLVYSNNANLTNVTFIRCKFRVPDANSNAIKLIVETGVANGVFFFECEIEGTGRMGLEVQNHVADTTVRYNDVVWEGGFIKDTGLIAGDGQGVSLSGYGENCRVDTLFDNNLFACIENVGASYSTFSGRAKNCTRSCDPVAFVNERAMTDNTIVDFKCMEQVNGDVLLRGQDRMRERDCIWRISGDYSVRDNNNGRHKGSTVVGASRYGIYVEASTGTAKGNRWEAFSLDNTAGPGNFAMVRFIGANAQGNEVLDTQMKYSGGVIADHEDGASTPLATTNVVRGSKDHLGAPITAALSVDVAAGNVDRSASPIAYEAYTYTGAPGAARTVTLPSSARFNALHRNSCGQDVTVKKSGGTGETFATTARKQAAYIGGDWTLN